MKARSRCNEAPGHQSSSEGSPGQSGHKRSQSSHQQCWVCQTPRLSRGYGGELLDTLPHQHCWTIYGCTGIFAIAEESSRQKRSYSRCCRLQSEQSCIEYGHVNDSPSTDQKRYLRYSDVPWMGQDRHGVTCCRTRGLGQHCSYAQDHGKAKRIAPGCLYRQEWRAHSILKHFLKTTQQKFLIRVQIV
ncbi:hypothetical protein TNCT_615691 [Trichonephila clavata]|uniref:Uncharacterized protein n=1 Tax=Trichonephila clavata TaxID=2740835 RepID=A0A8X6KSZ7_TRICU|nr:hypothetical protein TNCT_615691 [Trichonephila clavata]